MKYVRGRSISAWIGRETSQGRIKTFHSFLPQQLEIDFFPSIVETFNAVSSF